MKLKPRAYLIASTLLVSPSAVWADANSDAVTHQACLDNPGAIGCNGVKIFGQQGIVTTIISTLIFVVGAVSVVMIVIGGLRYALSGGDSAGIKSAKDTILYAVVGLVVAILAYAIVQFVIGKVG